MLTLTLLFGVAHEVVLCWQSSGPGLGSTTYSFSQEEVCLSGGTSGTCVLVVTTLSVVDC